MTDTGTTPVIRFDSASKAFGTTTVLDNFDLDISDGEKLAVIGPSGSGKSTLLRILMTLETIDSGSVFVDGEFLWEGEPGEPSRAAPPKRVRQIRRKVGMVFQSFNLFPHMTAIQNVAEAPRRVLGLSKSDATGRARDLLALVGLSDKEGNYPSQLSGGQQQRVAIARAMAMRPKILLFDEVTSALDPELVGEVLNVIRQLANEQYLTIIMVTHQMGFAREIADRVCFLEHGQVVEQGDPEQIFGNPSNQRTQEFLKAVLTA